MAKMIECPKCKKTYCSTSDVCPECGVAKPKNTKKTVAIALACIAGAILIGILSVLWWEANSAPVTEIETGGIPSSSDMQSES